MKSRLNPVAAVVVLGVGSILLLGAPSGDGSSSRGRVGALALDSTECGSRYARVLFESSVSIDSGLKRRVVDAVVRASMPTVFQEALCGDRITVSIVSSLPVWVEARARPIDGLIILPARSANWIEPRLVRTIRHELGHLGLAKVGLDATASTLPRWVTEGVAEWAAGGLTPAGALRVKHDLERGGPDRLLVADDRSMSIDARLAYDYYGTFFEYVELRSKGKLSSGRLFGLAEVQGMKNAIEMLLETPFSDVREAWLDWLAIEVLEPPRVRRRLSELSPEGSD